MTAYRFLYREYGNSNNVGPWILYFCFTAYNTEAGAARFVKELNHRDRGKRLWRYQECPPTDIDYPGNESAISERMRNQVTVIWRCVDEPLPGSPCSPEGLDHSEAAAGHRRDEAESTGQKRKHNHPHGGKRASPTLPKAGCRAVQGTRTMPKK